MIKKNIAIENNRIVSCVDEITFYCDRDNCCRASLIGWVFAKDDGTKKIEVEVDGQQISYELADVDRLDVKKIYTSYPVKANCGFALKFTFDKGDKKNPVIIVKCSDMQGEMNTFLETTVEEIEKYGPASEIRYQIEQMIVGNDVITVSGWAFEQVVLQGELQAKAVQIEVTEQNGNAIESKVRRKYRKDVNEMFMAKGDLQEYGFDIKWKNTLGEEAKYIVALFNGNTRQVINVDCNEIYASVREASRKYENFWEMITQRDEKMLADDWRYLRRNGFMKWKEQIAARYDGTEAVYNIWRRAKLSSKECLKEQRQQQFEYMPCISVIVPTYKTPKQFLVEMIESVRNQSYTNWELCIGDGSVTDSVVADTVAEYRKKDSRIKLKVLSSNDGIAGNTNAALELATGDYIALLDHDDLYTPDALYEMVERINNSYGQETDMLYSDEDKVSFDLKNYFEPHFKSDFNLDLLRSNNYICHLLVVKREIANAVGGFHSEYDGSQDYDFILRCAEQSSHIEHIAKVLYHWRCHPNSTAMNQESKMYCYESGKRAIEDHLERMSIEGCTVAMTKHLGFYHVEYPVQNHDKVSIIIPNKDQKDILQRCIDSILDRTNYDNYEIIVVENNSTTDEIFTYYKEIEQQENIRVIYWEKQFNYSAINNWGVSQTDGEYLLFLNNDIEVISAEWMTELLANAQRKEVGIVGARLLYPDDTVQHAGVIIGMGGIAGHAFSRYPNEDTGYFARAIIQQNLNAVTAACMMARREVFDEVGGFEEGLAVAFNDVDFCLKVRDKGYLVVYNPEAELYHHESISRGSENTVQKQERFEQEVTYMQNTWKQILEKGDEYYNPNLSLQSGKFELRNQ